MMTYDLSKMRRCSFKDCKQMKDENDFYSDYDLYCKECRKTYTNKWNQKKKEKKEQNTSDEILISFMNELHIINEKLEKIGEAIGIDLVKD